MNLFGMSYRLNLPPVTAGVPIIPCRCCALTLPGTPGLCRGHLLAHRRSCARRRRNKRRNWNHRHVNCVGLKWFQLSEERSIPVSAVLLGAVWPPDVGLFSAGLNQISVSERGLLRIAGISVTTGRNWPICQSRPSAAKQFVDRPLLSDYRQRGKLRRTCAASHLHRSSQARPTDEQYPTYLCTSDRFDGLVDIGPQPVRTGWSGNAPDR